MAGSMRQTIFTVVSPVQSGKQGELYDKLAGLRYFGGPPAKDVFGFADAEMLHFASVFLYDDPQDGWFLVFESNIDGGIEPYLDRLLAIAQERDGGDFLLSLYRHCHSFAGQDLAQLKRYMMARLHHPAAGYVSAVGLTCGRIRQDAAVYRVVDDTLGSGVPALPSEQLTGSVLQALQEDPETKDKWSESGHGSNGLAGLARFSALLVLALKAIFHVILALINLIRERVARQDNLRPDLDLVLSQKHYEDFLPTNHMVSVVHLHTDLGRKAAKHLAFGILRAAVKAFFYKGKLGPIDTIHFAHWVFLNQDRRLLFVSNYGGSWDSYLDDFTLKANVGLTLAWAHGIGFPKSWFMLLGGAAQGPEFIDWARRSMVPSLVWYKAYPGVSAANIRRNRKLCEALVAARNGGSQTNWLEFV